MFSKSQDLKCDINQRHCLYNIIFVIVMLFEGLNVKCDLMNFMLCLISIRNS